MVVPVQQQNQEVAPPGVIQAWLVGYATGHAGLLRTRARTGRCTSKQPNQAQ
jgi:hypothetical protein